MVLLIDCWNDENKCGTFLKNVGELHGWKQQEDGLKSDFSSDLTPFLTIIGRGVQLNIGGSAHDWGGGGARALPDTYKSYAPASDTTRGRNRHVIDDNWQLMKQWLVASCL